MAANDMAATWDAFCDTLKVAGQELTKDHVPQDEQSQADRQIANGRSPSPAFLPKLSKKAHYRDDDADQQRRGQDNGQTGGRKGTRALSAYGIQYDISTL